MSIIQPISAHDVNMITKVAPPTVTKIEPPVKVATARIANYLDDNGVNKDETKASNELISLRKIYREDALDAYCKKNNIQELAPFKVGDKDSAKMRKDAYAEDVTPRIKYWHLISEETKAIIEDAREEYIESIHVSIQKKQQQLKKKKNTLTSETNAAKRTKINDEIETIARDLNLYKNKLNSVDDLTTDIDAIGHSRTRVSPAVNSDVAIIAEAVLYAMLENAVVNTIASGGTHVDTKAFITEDYYCLKTLIESTDVYQNLRDKLADDEIDAYDIKVKQLEANIRTMQIGIRSSRPKPKLTEAVQGAVNIQMPDGTTTTSEPLPEELNIRSDVVSLVNTVDVDNVETEVVADNSMANFFYYAGKVVKDVLQNYPSEKNIRISHDAKTFCSTVIIELLHRIVRVVPIFISVRGQSTLSQKIALAIIESFLCGADHGDDYDVLEDRIIRKRAETEAFNEQKKTEAAKVTNDSVTVLPSQNIIQPIIIPGQQ